VLSSAAAEGHANDLAREQRHTGKKERRAGISANRRTGDD
jgi:hypothetical protein